MTNASQPETLKLIVKYVDQNNEGVVKTEEMPFTESESAFNDSSPVWWLLFNGSEPVAVVILGNVASGVNIRQVRPTRIRAYETGVVIDAGLSDGSKGVGDYQGELIRFDSTLRGTAAYWENLDHSDLTSDQKDLIRGKCSLSSKTGSDMLTIQEAAEYTHATKRRIYNLLRKVNGDGSPLIAGVIGKGRLTRIPRASLESFRRADKTTREPKKTPLKRTLRKPVKQSK